MTVNDGKQYSLSKGMLLNYN